jgi:CobQ-like glutamine amidotransferase family enzyme
LSTESVVRIGLLFPDLLGTYGDRGNALVLCDRLRRRRIATELVEVDAGDPIPSSLDCYLLGGAEDRAERAAATLLRDAGFAAMFERGASVVGVCAGFQLLGTHIELGTGETFPGVGLIDAVTRPATERHVGDVVLEPSDPSLGPVTGFENHGAITTCSDTMPLGTVRNEGRTEGVLGPRLLATYLHGPVLVRNPKLADHVLSWTTGPLAPIEADLAVRLHDNLARRGATRT